MIEFHIEIILRRLLYQFIITQSLNLISMIVNSFSGQ